MQPSRVFPAAAGLLAVSVVPATPAADALPARVEEAEVLLLQGDTLGASVHVAGLLGSPCGALAAPQVTRRGTTFSVLLAEAVPPSGAVCQALQAQGYFDVALPLDLQGLPPGRYRVQVNHELLLEFELEPPPP